jgi:ribosomal protein L32
MARAALAARVLQTSKIFSPSFRSHHSLWISPHCRSLMDPILVPGPEIPDDNSAAAIKSPFMQVMAVPKRKVSPSRKGKRNGPKARKPVPVVAKCKVCGRIKLPHFYCCSGEAKVEGI